MDILSKIKVSLKGGRMNIQNLIFADFDSTIKELESSVEKLKRCKRVHNEGIVYREPYYSLNKIEEKMYQEFLNNHKNHNVVVKFESNGIFLSKDAICLDCDENSCITDLDSV